MTAGRRKLWVAAVFAALAAGCRDKSPGLDLLVPARLGAGQAAGHDVGWITGEIGKTVRIHDVVERTIPAPAPSRLEFPVRVPRGGHLTVSCGIPETRHGQPGVEFVVKVREGNKDRALASRLLDPINRPAHQRWVPMDVDLSKLEGNQTLVLETRGF
jgi:hypothetical protein